MNLLDETVRDWNQLGDSDRAEILARIEQLAASGTYSAMAILTKLGVECKVINVPMDKVLKTMAKQAFKLDVIDGTSLETIQSLIKLGSTSAAAVLLRRQKPATAYRIIQELLLSGKIGGAEAISLICQSIPQEHWSELVW